MSYNPDGLDDTYSTWAVSAVIMAIFTGLILVASMAYGPLNPHVHALLDSVVGKPQQTVQSHIPYLPHRSHMLTLSNDSKEAVRDLFESAPENISAVIVSSINFEKNSFTPIFAVNDSRDEYTQLPSGSLFTDSQSRNDHVLTLMTGKTVCGPYNPSQTYSRFSSDAEWSCAVAVPPSAYREGRLFGGFMTIMFTSRLSERGEASFLKKAKATAAAIYQKDVER